MCQRCDYPELLQHAALAPLPNRVAVLEIVGNSPSPLSTQEIFDIVRRSQRMNRVTLYRILDLLVEKDLVHRISAGDRSFRYGLAPNANHPRHPHFYCSRCGNMECLAPEAVNVDTRSLERTFPALIQKVEIRLDGVCRSCLKIHGSGSRRDHPRTP
ncbi:MAG: transcriptional repressor [Syntrophobacteraceae bacterium]|jgi:Fur family ferric uptake transcriptional regulator|nr:transcriptional repressor [Syntrophobacteraceae bacterium]